MEDPDRRQKTARGTAAAAARIGGLLAGPIIASSRATNVVLALAVVSSMRVAAVCVRMVGVESKDLTLEWGSVPPPIDPIR